MNYLTIGLTTVAFVSGFYLQGLRSDAEISAIKLQHSNALTVATQKASEDTNTLQRKKDEALKQAQISAAKNAAANAALNSQLEWMRDYNARNSAAISNSTCSSVRDYAATATTVFSECTTALTGMAEKAQGHALDSRTLRESWPVLKDNK
jgi:hypothetical protein